MARKTEDAKAEGGCLGAQCGDGTCVSCQVDMARRPGPRDRRVPVLPPQGGVAGEAVSLFRPIPRANSGYRCAVIDPPWSFKDKVTRNAPEQSVGAGYSTLSTTEIAELPVPDLLAPSALVFLWAPDTHLFEAKWLLDWWGLGYKHLAVWVKTYGAAEVEAVEGEGDLDCGMGNYMRKSHEVALVAATPGLRARRDLRDRRVRSVIVAPRGRHSQKPEGLQDAAERLISGPYLELFARRRRPGWACWGDELTEE